jgi:hypothetical protein
LRLSAISSGVRRWKRDRVVAIGDDTDTLAASVGVVELAPVDAKAVAPTFVWRKCGGKRFARAGVATLTWRSNARAKLMVDYRSSGHCISTSVVIGSPKPAVKKFMACAAESPSQRQSRAKNSH